MDITKRLLELNPDFQLHNEGEWDKPFDPEKPGYSSFNDAGIEVETGEFLYSFVRMLKPDHVLETGTHWGVGASYMGLALKENNHGDLDTIEFLPEIHQRAKKNIEKLGLKDRVTCLLVDAAKYDTNKTFKLILLDTEPHTRFAELLKFFPALEDGGFVFIHDLHQHMHQVDNKEHGFAWPYGQLPFELVKLIQDNKLLPFHIETPRGLTGFYKPHPEDFFAKNKYL